jgi:peptide/nickel transport system substrate-binding protein
MAKLEEPSSSSWRRFSRLRPNRKLLRRRARKIESATVKHAHTFLIHRWENVRDVRRHALGWMLLVGLLIALSGVQIVFSQRNFMADSPADGGTFAEGVLGDLDTINPIFASTSAERTASKLVFASLLSYDSQNQLRGELASTWKVEQDGKRYVVSLRPNLTWHDGAPLTADDVVFTVGLMQNPLTRSSLYSTWTGIKVSKIDDHTVAFDLQGVYAPFAHALTFGILPEHILGGVAPERIRENGFNRNPIGSGPFEFHNLQVLDPDQNRLILHLAANPNYVLGKPRLDRFQLHTYKDSEGLRRGFVNGEVTSAAELTTADVKSIQSQKGSTKTADVPLYDGMYALFKNDSDLLTDVGVRKALRLAINRPEVIKSLDGMAQSLEGPLLPEQYNPGPDLRQPQSDPKAAAAQLDALGWVKGKDGIRAKGDQKMSLIVVSRRNGDFPKVLESIAKQWRAIGVDVQTQLVDSENIALNIQKPRAYDVLIEELRIGADPDVFAYWHSSQATPTGLNLANYKSGLADDALSSARARLEPVLREAKYRTFVQQWLNDVPAIALYRPTMHYVMSANAETLTPTKPIVDLYDRYNSVQYWTIEHGYTYTTP